jgi:hypothetical protein
MQKPTTFVGMDAHKVEPVEWSVANEKAAVRRMVRKVRRLACRRSLRSAVFLLAKEATVIIRAKGASGVTG